MHPTTKRDPTPPVPIRAALVPPLTPRVLLTDTLCHYVTLLRFTTSLSLVLQAETNMTPSVTYENQKKLSKRTHCSHTLTAPPGRKPRNPPAGGVRKIGIYFGARCFGHRLPQPVQPVRITD